MRIITRSKCTPRRASRTESFSLISPLVCERYFSALGMVSIAENVAFCNRPSSTRGLAKSSGGWALSPKGLDLLSLVEFDYRLLDFVSRLDSLARLAHFTNDQVIAETAPDQIIE